MAETLRLEVVTAERLVLNAEATEITIPGKSGYIGVLPGHAPLITELAVGEIAYRNAADGKSVYLAVAWGFAEVLPDKVTVLAEVAERAEDIDIIRAKRDRVEAEEALKHPEAGVDYVALQAALDHANARLAAVSRSNHEIANFVP